MSLLYQIPTWIQRLYRGVLWRRQTVEKTVYLTFDDGPIPEVTPHILRILREKDVKATFFVVGDNVRKNPDLLENILIEGHRVGNHTFHHLKGLKCSTQDYLADVEQCQSYVRCANDSAKLFRPPYGRMRYSQKRELIKMGYTIVLWDVLTHDYNSRYTADRMVDIVKKYVRNGSIIVFHDSLKSNGRMLEALPKVIDFLKEEGYIFSDKL